MGKQPATQVLHHFHLWWKKRTSGGKAWDESTEGLWSGTSVYFSSEWQCYNRQEINKKPIIEENREWTALPAVFVHPRKTTQSGGEDAAGGRPAQYHLSVWCCSFPQICDKAGIDSSPLLCLKLLCGQEHVCFISGCCCRGPASAGCSR